VLYVVAGMVVLAGLILLDLALTMAIVRKLRQHTAKLSTFSAMASMKPGLAPGQRVPPFEVVTTTGTSISATSLRGGAIAFMSTTCKACPEQLPALREYLTSARADGTPTLAVIEGEGDDAARMAASLQGLTSVVVEQEGGPAHKAFQVRGYPSFFVLDPDSVIHTATFNVRELPKPVPAS
jgi:peroxiredoxin